MMRKLIPILALLAISASLHTTTARAAMAALPPIPEGKARLFLGKYSQYLDPKYILSSDKQTYAEWKDWYTKHFAFYVLQAQGDELVPFASFSRDRDEYLEERYFIDLEPGQYTFANYGRMRRGRAQGTLVGHPGILDIQLSPGQSYQVAIGIKFSDGEINIHGMQDVTLSPERFEECKALRSAAESLDTLLAAVLQSDARNHAEMLACETVASAQANPEPSKRYFKWVKSRRKILNMLYEDTREHEAKNAS